MTAPGQPVADALRTFLAAGARVGLFVDFDGTLAPIAPDPNAVEAESRSAAVLTAYAERCAVVAIVTGRPIADFSRFLPPLRGVDLYGAYGMERGIGGEYTVDPRSARNRDAIVATAASMRAAFPELRVEEKLGAMCVVHWREHPDREPEVLALAERLAAEHGLTLHSGRMVIELRVPDHLTKAITMTGIAASVDRVIVAGDDVADLEAFDALDEAVARGELEAVYKIGVASSEAPPGLVERATTVVEGPSALMTLLAAALGEPPAPTLR